MNGKEWKKWMKAGMTMAENEELGEKNEQMNYRRWMNENFKN